MECNTSMSLARICNARCPPSSLFSNIPRLLNRSYSHLSPTINPSSSSSSSSSSLVLPRLIHNRKFHLSKCCSFSDSASAVPLKSKIQKPTINFCQKCGGPTKYSVPEGEEKERAVCTTCGHVYYENPKMVVGCLIQHDNKVLLCKRKIPPSYGLWTLPAGYLELDESAAAGAIRETFEEACAEAEILSPFAQLDIPVIGQSYIIFRAQLKNPDFSPGPETLECALFQLDEIPFQSLAFSSVSVTLKLFIEDANAGKFNFHYCIIEKRPGASPSDLQGFVVSQHIKS